MRLKLRHILAAVLAVCLLSCSKDGKDGSVLSGEDKMEGVIAFDATKEADGFTRAVVNRLDDIKDQRLGVIAQMSSQSDFSSDVNDIYRNTVSSWDGYQISLDLKDGNRYSPFGSSQKDWAWWDIRKYYRFRGFWPLEMPATEGTWINGGDKITDMSLKMSYILPANPKEATDFLVSDVVSRDKGDTAVVKLEMKHQLACVTFKFVEPGESHLTGVAFFNYMTKAEYSTDNGFSKQSTPRKCLNGVNPTSKYDLFSITSDYYTPADADKDNYEDMLMIPQSISFSDSETVFSNPTLFVKFYVGNDKDKNKITAEVDLTNKGHIDEWEKGKKYTYTISLYEYQVTANITIEDWQTEEPQIIELDN